jgi:hypothetical protein
VGWSPWSSASHPSGGPAGDGGDRPRRSGPGWDRSSGSLRPRMHLPPPPEPEAFDRRSGTPSR